MEKYKIITLQNFINLTSGNIIYSPIYHIYQKKQNVIPPEFIPPNYPYKLITHGGDAIITEDYFKILNDENLIIWYAINVGIEHPKLKHLPIGIQFPKEYKEKDFINFLNFKIKKTKTIYTNFTVHPFLEERIICNDSLKKEGFKNLAENNSLFINPIIPYKRYIYDLASHKFCVNPIGYGFDTFRLWECLYLKCIPVMLNKINGNKYYSVWKKMLEDLPILWINEWGEVKDLNEDIYQNIIQTKKTGLEKLNFIYWKNKIIE